MISGSEDQKKKRVTACSKYIVQPGLQLGMYFQKVKFHISGYNLRHTPHILILFFCTWLYSCICTYLYKGYHGNNHNYLANGIFMVFGFFVSIVLYTFEFFNNFLVDERSHQARQFVVPDL